MGVCRFAFYIRDLEHPCILVPVGGCVGNMCLGLPAISERGVGGWEGGRGGRSRSSGSFSGVA